MLNIKAEVAAHCDELIALRRDFHKHPELGYAEYRTSEKITGYLKDLGLSPKTVAKTGVVALIEGEKPGPCLLLRADMDALPQSEDTGVDYASVNEGVMHACAHDGHMAMLLIAAKILCGHKDLIAGSVKLVFQPNEEEAGALDMINEGIMENPKVDAAMALHIWTPVESGNIGVSTGPVIAALEEFEITVTGKAGHTSTPHTAVDAIIAACALVQSLQVIQTRQTNPLYPLAIMVGKINGGTGRNIIAGSVKLGGTLRFNFPNYEAERTQLIEGFERIVAGTCETYGVTCDIKYIHGNPTLFNDEKMISYVRRAAAEVYGSESCIVEHRCMAGEDFAEFSQRVPSAFYFIGTGNSEKQSCFPHHHPKFNIDEDSLEKGVEMHVRSALDFLK